LLRRSLGRPAFRGSAAKNLCESVVDARESLNEWRDLGAAASGHFEIFLEAADDAAGIDDVVRRKQDSSRCQRFTSLPRCELIVGGAGDRASSYGLGRVFGDDAAESAGE